MKRILILLSLAASMMLSSCTKIIREEYREEIFVDPDISNIIINVRQSDWAYSDIDNNNYFYANVKIPEINKDVLMGSLVKMYRVYDKNVHAELPYVRPVEYQIKGDDWGFYTETVDYEFGEGYVTIFYTVSDFEYEIDPSIIPDAMKFRLCILY